MRTFLAIAALLALVGCATAPVKGDVYSSGYVHLEPEPAHVDEGSAGGFNALPPLRLMVLGQSGPLSPTDPSSSAPLYGRSLTLSQASGSNAIAFSTDGARIDFGSGASDWCSSSSGIVTCADFQSNAAVRSSTFISLTSYLFMSGKTALGTCTSTNEGQILLKSGTGGTSSGARTVMCVCTSDGAASPTFAWVSMFKDAASQLGTASTCPN